MSSGSVSRDGVDPDDVADRVTELEAVREDLEHVADSEADYAAYAQTALEELEAIDDE